MRTRLRARIRFVDSLGFRVAALLSIALLPLGVVAALQNIRTLNEAERLTTTALIGRTAEAAAAERALMLTTFGAAEGLVESVIALRDDPAACHDLLSNFVKQSGAVNFAGFTGTDGIQQCYSQGRELDVRDNPKFQRMQTLREPFISATAVGLQSGEPVVTIRWPMQSEGEYLGYLVLSIPNQAIEDIRNFGGDHANPSLVTFNQFGEVLTTDEGDSTEVSSRVPAGRPLVELARDQDQTFRDLNRRGDPRI